MFIFKQITLIISNINKFNLRLIRAFQYFFNFNIFVRYKVNKLNIVLDVLFKLLNKHSQSNIKNKIEIFNVFYNYSMNFFEHKLHSITLQNLLIIVFYVILIKIFNEFKQRLKTVYAKNFY